MLVDLSGGVVAGHSAPLDLGAGTESLLEAVESAVHDLVRSGLPALGAGGTSGVGAEGATGGEVWQRAPAGEEWTGRRAKTPAAAAPAAERAALDEARRAVAEEGELWSDEETGRATPQPGPGPAAEPAGKTAAETEEGEGAPEPGRPADRTAEPEGGAEAEAAAVAEVTEAEGAEAEVTEAEAAEAESVEAAEAPDSAGLPPGAGSRWGSVVGVGVAVPGPLDHVRGVLRDVTGAPRLAGFPLRDALARRLGLPVVVDKDTDAAALGLALRGKESLAYLHLGTGLGAGLVLDGRIHRGGRNGAGEFGHQVVQLDGPPCRCGRNGCLEALCLEAVRHGRTDEAARVLGVGAANLVSLLGVDRVLLGGRTVLAAPDAYVDGVAAQLRGAAGVAGAARDVAGGGGRAVRVELAPEGTRSVADGAAQLVLAPLFGRAPGAPANGG
nr:ROK family protein [Streptomyces sp. WMMB 322]